MDNAVLSNQQLPLIFKFVIDISFIKRSNKINFENVILSHHPHLAQHAEDIYIHTQVQWHCNAMPRFSKNINWIQYLLLQNLNFRNENFRVYNFKNYLISENLNIVKLQSNHPYILTTLLMTHFLWHGFSMLMCNVKNPS